MHVFRMCPNSKNNEENIKTTSPIRVVSFSAPLLYSFGFLLRVFFTSHHLTSYPFPPSPPLLSILPNFHNITISIPTTSYPKRLKHSPQKKKKFPFPFPFPFSIPHTLSFSSPYSQRERREKRMCLSLFHCD